MPQIGTMILRESIIRIACLAAVVAIATPLAFSQDSSELKPPPYAGVTVHVEGVFVTPIPSVPFTAVVDLQTTQILPDGSTDVRKTINHIARDSRGRIYNERRRWETPTTTGNPRLLAFHIFDPDTRLNTFLDPATHIARQTTRPAPAPYAQPNPGASASPGDPLIAEEDLGTESMEGVLVHGRRATRTVPAAFSGTGKNVLVTDEYWYSDELHLNMLVKHDDPRSGRQTVAVTRVERNEPNQAMFEIPASYKVVDETPEH
jgi:hypothetical protein